MLEEHEQNLMRNQQKKLQQQKFITPVEENTHTDKLLTSKEYGATTANLKEPNAVTLSSPMQAA